MTLEIKIILIEFIMIIATNTMWILGFKAVNDSWAKQYREHDEEWREVCREINSEYMRNNLNE